MISGATLVRMLSYFGVEQFCGMFVCAHVRFF